jgi:hypothetical protein
MVDQRCGENFLLLNACEGGFALLLCDLLRLSDRCPSCVDSAFQSVGAVIHLQHLLSHRVPPSSPLVAAATPPHTVL